MSNYRKISAAFMKITRHGLLYPDNMAYHFLKTPPLAALHVFGPCGQTLSGDQLADRAAQRNRRKDGIEMGTVKFATTANSESATRTAVTARQFQIIIDEPKSLGGSDYGPNPVEYILAAVSGCLNVVGHLVASEMGFSLKGLAIEAEGDLDPARFQGKSYNERAGYKEIRIKLKPDADADIKTLEKWKAAVCDRCPVSDNLKEATPVSITLA